MTGPPDRSRRRLARRGTRAAALATVLVLGLVGLGGWWLIQRHRVHVAAAGAQAAAERYVETLTNFDTAADPAVTGRRTATLLDGAADPFRRMVARSGDQLRAFQRDHRVSAQGRIVDSAVEDASTTGAVVDLTVEETVRNRDLAEPDVDDTELRLTMTRVDGRWLVSRMELA
ncbi:hypothetical protein ABQE69_05265 [Mycolicibacillus trivialis]